MSVDFAGNLTAYNLMVGVVAKCYEFDLTEALKVYYLAITIPFNGIFVPVITNGYIEVRYTSD